MLRLNRLLIGAVLCGATMVPALDADAATPGIYVVRSGDSLYGIASRLDVPVTDLMSANGLQLTSVIFPGQQLRVPGGAAPSSAPGQTYVVQPGDWLARIASRHGVGLAALLETNGLRATSLIMPGQRLVVPGTSGGGGGGGGGGGAVSGTYTVRAGDWLARIASQHGVGLRALLDANGLNVSSLILPGQQLRIPAGGTGTPASPAPSAPASGGSYTIRAGDTLAGIAARHRVSLSALLGANGFTVHTLIMPGMRVSLPATATAAEAPDAPRSGGVGQVLSYAMAQVGKPYRFLGRGPYYFDCSGLVLAAYERAGIKLVHYSAAQARQGVPVNWWSQPIQAGDLVFQDTDGNGVINHVGIATSSTMWVQARSARYNVTYGPLPRASSIVAVRRVLPTG